MVLDCIFPRKQDTANQQPTPVVVMSDLVDPGAAAVCGPIDASDGKDVQLGTVVVRDPGGRREAGEKRQLPARIPSPLVLVSTRRLQPMRPYRGNTARGIGKETSYTVKLNGTVQLVYTVGSNEQALLTTDDHPDLIDLVNKAKRQGGSPQGGGRFLINEYRHVLVPTQDGEVLYAGVYTRDLEFEFEGTLISPVAPSAIRPRGSLARTSCRHQVHTRRRGDGCSLRRGDPTTHGAPSVPHRSRPVWRARRSPADAASGEAERRSHLRE